MAGIRAGRAEKYLRLNMGLTHTEAEEIFATRFTGCCTAGVQTHSARAGHTKTARRTSAKKLLIID